MLLRILIVFKHKTSFLFRLTCVCSQKQHTHMLFPPRLKTFVTESISMMQTQQPLKVKCVSSNFCATKQNCKYKECFQACFLNTPPVYHWSDKQIVSYQTLIIGCVQSQKCFNTENYTLHFKNISYFESFTKHLKMKETLHNVAYIILLTVCDKSMVTPKSIFQ